MNDFCDFAILGIEKITSHIHGYKGEMRMGTLARFLGWLLFAGSIIGGFVLMPAGRTAPCYVASGCASEVGTLQIAFALAGIISGLAWLVILDTIGKLRAALDNGAFAPAIKAEVLHQDKALPSAPIKIGDQVRTRGGEVAIVEAIDELGAATIRMGNGDSRMVGVNRLVAIAAEP
jgi:hypothetical protein